MNDEKTTEPHRLAIVMIGRNEGSRLESTLHRAIEAGYPIVYVDSDSRDDSVAFAKGLSISVAELKESEGLAARSGNCRTAMLLSRSFFSRFTVRFLLTKCRR